MKLLLESYEKINKQLKEIIESHKLTTDDDYTVMRLNDEIVSSIERQINYLKEHIFRIAYNKHLQENN